MWYTVARFVGNQQLVILGKGEESAEPVRPLAEISLSEREVQEARSEIGLALCGLAFLRGVRKAMAPLPQAIVECHACTMTASLTSLPGLSHEEMVARLPEELRRLMERFELLGERVARDRGARPKGAVLQGTDTLGRRMVDQCETVAIPPPPRPDDLADVAQEGEWAR